MSGIQNEINALLVQINEVESKSLLLQEEARHILERCISTAVSFDPSLSPMTFCQDVQECFTHQVESTVSSVLSSVEIGDVRPLYTELYPVRLYKDRDGMVHAVCRYFEEGAYRRFSPKEVDLPTVDIYNPSELFGFVRSFSDISKIR